MEGLNEKHIYNCEPNAIVFISELDEAALSLSLLHLTLSY